MYLLRAVSGLAVAAVIAVPVSAQSIAQLGGPAETPPASYSSDQYVDSRGCVFIRAGYGGQETWVPRVTRDRQPLCGYEPSLGGQAPVAVAAAPEPPVEEPPVEIVVAPAAEQPAVPAAQPRPVAPSVASVAAAPPAPVAPVVQPTAPGQMVSCQGLPANAAQYMQGSGVRCGPQAIHPSDGQPVLRMAGASSPSRHTAVVPVQVPEGYRPAWDDGRLNPARGLVNATPEGDAAMAQLWTETVPRVAVDPTADGLAVSRASATPAAHPVVTRASSTPNIAAQDTAAQATGLSVPAGHRYVEIARYGDRATADAARLRLQQQGMATVLGGIAQQEGGYGTFVVLAGPFDDARTLGLTLSAARDLGYGGAVTR